MFKRRSYIKKVILFAMLLFCLVTSFIIKMKVVLHPHDFTETEAIRILAVKSGACNQPAKGIDIPTDISYRDYPKLIHRIFLVWKGKSAKIPEDWKENMKVCQEMTPDYHHIIWDDEMVISFFNQHYPWFVDTYNSYTYDVMRVDAAKYFILYHYGGIYLDLDERCVTDLKELMNKMPLGYGMYIPQGNPTGLSNAVFMAKKCHNFLGYVISRMRHDSAWYGVPYATIMFSTGPRFFTFKYSEYIDRVQMPGDEPIYVFPTDYVIKHRYIEKIKGQTWFSWDGAIIFTFYQLWRMITFQIPV